MRSFAARASRRLLSCHRWVSVLTVAIGGRAPSYHEPSRRPQPEPYQNNEAEHADAEGATEQPA